MAEDTGFEPAVPEGYNGFQDRRFQPLSQSSAFDVKHNRAEGTNLTI